MRLQISSQLAIFAIIELAAHPERQLTVGEIGAKYGASNHHLAKIMHILGRAGLVRSIRGVGGGYQFSGNARRTTLLDVIELFEDLSPASVGQASSGSGTAEGRALHLVLGEIDDATRATLGSITLDTLCALAAREGARAAAREP
ncbi:MAG: Rrf2 family transcriptional regulator [Proteobacteria bacterium]|nr:Rrf2 family transcriptional regulator [Pseudomonadota bacterium]